MGAHRTRYWAEGGQWVHKFNPVQPPVDPPPAPGVVRPDATNTGVPSTVTLTPHYGDIVVTVNGTVIDSMDVFGFIDVRARDVIIRNTKVRGSGPGTTNTGLITCFNAACLNLTVDHCTLVPDFPSYWLDGIFGKNFTAIACNIYHVVDGFGTFVNGPLNVKLYSNWVHDLSWFSPDPNHSDNHTHNDCWQIQGGTGAIAVGNRFDAFPSPDVGTQDPSAVINSAVQFNQGVGPLGDEVITDNWFDGGGDCMNLLGVSGPIGSILRNRFGRGMKWYPIDMKSTVTVNTGAGTSDQNYYLDNGAPITVHVTP